MNRDEIELVVCVGEKDIHIEESILTHCCKCDTKVWCSITNCDKKPVCMPCVIKLANENKEPLSFFTTPETMLEAIREIARREKDDRR